MMPPDPQLVAQAKFQALQVSLDPVLVCAVVEQESLWNQYALRAEPAFDEKYEKPLHLTATEEWARSMSWGLMQIMGESAREVGYAGAFPMLCAANVGLRVGCQFLALKLKEASGDVDKALLLWNGGGDAEYPAKVRARMVNYQ
jgi:soluble lytic murein transglycosylase-like protein